jgi:hypothetical protein
MITLLQGIETAEIALTGIGIKKNARKRINF